MARKSGSPYNNNLPKQIYFIQDKYNCYGPYSKKPTLLLKKKGGKLVQFDLTDHPDCGALIFMEK